MEEVINMPLKGQEIDECSQEQFNEASSEISNIQENPDFLNDYSGFMPKEELDYGFSLQTKLRNPMRSNNGRNGSNQNGERGSNEQFLNGGANILEPADIQQFNDIPVDQRDGVFDKTKKNMEHAPLDFEGVHLEQKKNGMVGLDIGMHTETLNFNKDNIGVEFTEIQRKKSMQRNSTDKALSDEITSGGINKQIIEPEAKSVEGELQTFKLKESNQNAVLEHTDTPIDVFDNLETEGANYLDPNNMFEFTNKQHQPGQEVSPDKQVTPEESQGEANIEVRKMGIPPPKSKAKPKRRKIHGRPKRPGFPKKKPNLPKPPVLKSPCLVAQHTDMKIEQLSEQSNNLEENINTQGMGNENQGENLESLKQNSHQFKIIEPELETKEIEIGFAIAEESNKGHIENHVDEIIHNGEDILFSGKEQSNLPQREQTNLLTVKPNLNLDKSKETDILKEMLEFLQTDFPNETVRSEQEFQELENKLQDSERTLTKLNEQNLIILKENFVKNEKLQRKQNELDNLQILLSGLRTEINSKDQEILELRNENSELAEEVQKMNSLEKSVEELEEQLDLKTEKIGKDHLDVQTKLDQHKMSLLEKFDEMIRSEYSENLKKIEINNKLSDSHFEKILSSLVTADKSSEKRSKRRVTKPRADLNREKIPTLEAKDSSSNKRNKSQHEEIQNLIKPPSIQKVVKISSKKNSSSEELPEIEVCNTPLKTQLKNRSQHSRKGLSSKNKKSKPKTRDPNMIAFEQTRKQIENNYLMTQKDKNEDKKDMDILSMSQPKHGNPWEETCGETNSIKSEIINYKKEDNEKASQFFKQGNKHDLDFDDVYVEVIQTEIGEESPDQLNLAQKQMNIPQSFIRTPTGIRPPSKSINTISSNPFANLKSNALQGRITSASKLNSNLQNQIDPKIQQYNNSGSKFNTQNQGKNPETEVVDSWANSFQPNEPNEVFNRSMFSSKSKVFKKNMLLRKKRKGLVKKKTVSKTIPDNLF